jgi:hypothetical protein
VRLAVTVVWSVAALCWLPWFALLMAFAVEQATGVGLARSRYFETVFIGLWPVHGWLIWGVVSMYPVAAFCGMALTAIGWRLYWLSEQSVLWHGAGGILLSILMPPLALIFMYRDAKRRHRESNRELKTKLLDSIEDVA